MDNTRKANNATVRRPEKTYDPTRQKLDRRRSVGEQLNTSPEIRETNEGIVQRPEKAYDATRQQFDRRRPAAEDAHDKQSQQAIETDKHEARSSNDPEAVRKDVVKYLQKEGHNFENRTDTDKSIQETLELLDNHQQWTKDIQGLADDITKKYPPDQYSYVGLGRSPGAIIASMQARGLEATTLPLGKLKTQSGDLQSNVIPKMNNEESKNVREIIKEHLPPLRENKKILLIDYVQTGEGLKVGQELVKGSLNPSKTIKDRLFSQKSGQDVTVQAVGLHSEFSQGHVPKLHAAGLDTMRLPGSLDQQHSLASLIGGSKLKPFSPFYKFSLNDAKTGQQPEQNPLYGRMQKLFSSD